MMMNRKERIDNLVVLNLLILYSDDSVAAYKFGVNKDYFIEKFKSCLGDKLIFNYEYIKYCFKNRQVVNELDDSWIKKIEEFFFKFYTPEDFGNIKIENSEHLLHNLIRIKKIPQIKETRCYKIVNLNI